MKMSEAPWRAVAAATEIQGSFGSCIFMAVIHARWLTGSQKP
jgi:hypothetical protein